MERNVALDLLKLTMAAMVVGLHAGFLNDFSSLGYYITVNGIFRIAVPVFFVINTVSLKGKWTNCLVVRFT